MKKKAVSGIMITLMLIGMLTWISGIQPVKADWTWTETIYIRADGSVDPDTAPISTVDNITYTLTDNIVGDVPVWSSAIVVQRNNIVVDGVNYTLQGTGSGTGIDLSYRSKVKIKNMKIKAFRIGVFLFSLSSNSNSIVENNITNNNYGVWLSSSSNHSIIGNNIAKNDRQGVFLGSSSNNNSIVGNNIADNAMGIYIFSFCLNNSISGNNITSNTGWGVFLDWSANTTVSRNNIEDSNCGIHVRGSSNNTLSRNDVTNNYVGVSLESTSGNTLSENTIRANGFGSNAAHTRTSSNSIYHNNFVNNTYQAMRSHESGANIWDDGYPSGGNYWSDYEDRYPDAEELDDSGIWDTPYVIDENNQDNYPLMEPWSPEPPVPATIDELKTKIEELSYEGEIDNQGIVKSLIAKLNVAQKLVDKGKIEEAKSILEDDFILQVQNLSGIHITVEAADILIQSAEYIISHL